MNSIPLSHLNIPQKFKVQWRILNGTDVINIPDRPIDKMTMFSCRSFKKLIESFFNKKHIHIFKRSSYDVGLESYFLLDMNCVINFFISFGIDENYIYIKYNSTDPLKCTKATFRYEPKKHYNKK